MHNVVSENSAAIIKPQEIAENIANIVKQVFKAGMFDDTDRILLSYLVKEQLQQAESVFSFQDAHAIATYVSAVTQFSYEDITQILQDFVTEDQQLEDKQTNTIITTPDTSQNMQAFVSDLRSLPITQDSYKRMLDTLRRGLQISPIGEEEVTLLSQVLSKQLVESGQYLDRKDSNLLQTLLWQSLTEMQNVEITAAFLRDIIEETISMQQMISSDKKVLVDENQQDEYISNKNNKERNKDQWQSDVDTLMADNDKLPFSASIDETNNQQFFSDASEILQHPALQDSIDMEEENQSVSLNDTADTVDSILQDILMDEANILLSEIKILLSNDLKNVSIVAALERAIQVLNSNAQLTGIVIVTEVIYAMSSIIEKLPELEDTELLKAKNVLEIGQETLVRLLDMTESLSKREVVELFNSEVSSFFRDAD